MERGGRVDGQSSHQPHSDTVPSASPQGDDSGADEQQAARSEQQTACQTERAVATGNGIRRTTGAAAEAGVDLGRDAR